MAFIESIGTALPGHRYATEEICSFLQKGADETARRKLKVLLAKSGIRNRYSVLPDFRDETTPVLFGPATVPVEKRMECFDHFAPGLAISAIENCWAESGYKKDQITHFITVSCTGMSAPGLEIVLSQKLSLRTDVAKLAVNFMGCYGVFHALKIAGYISGSNPDAVVMITSVELCTIHFQRVFDDDNLLANTLFGDGAAACIVSGKQPLGLGIKLDKFYQKTVPESAGHMAWQIASKGFLLNLSSYVPHAISQNLGNNWCDLDEFMDTTDDDIVFAVHPGGKNILSSVEKGLGIPSEKLQESYLALKEHGNLSSATILFVLKRMLENSNKKPLLAMGFGPGLTLEMFTGKIC